MAIDIAVAEGTGKAERVVRSSARVGKLGALLVFAVLSLLMTYPLILNLQTAVPGAPGDNYVWLEDLWWFRHSIVDLGVWPESNATLFYPFGVDLPLTESMLANKILIAPMLFWGNEVLAYNALVLLSFVLTGYTSYLLMVYLTHRPLAALVGAAAFTFSPFRMHLVEAGWLPLLATQWLPLVLLYLERTLRERKVRYSLALGLFVGLSILSSWLYLYVILGMLILYVLFRGVVQRDQGENASRVRDFIWAAMVVAAMVVPVVLLSAGSGGVSMPTLSEVVNLTAGFDDFFLPGVYHPLWGDFFLGLRTDAPGYPNYLPGFAYLGLVTLLLAVGAIAKGSKAHPQARTFFWVGAFSFVIALGVVLRWGGNVVQVSAPEWLEALSIRVMTPLMGKIALNKASYTDIANQAGKIPIVLPGMLLYLFTPAVGAARALYAFGIVSTLATAVLAAMGAAPIIAEPGAKPIEEGEAWGKYDVQVVTTPKTSTLMQSLLVALVLLSLVLIDVSAAPLAFGMSSAKAQPLDQWLASQSGTGAVARFPLADAYTPANHYRSHYLGKPAAYGYESMEPVAYRQALPELLAFPSEASLSVLRDWGVRYVIVNAGAYMDGLGDGPHQTWEEVQRQIEGSPSLRLVGVSRDESAWLDARIARQIQAGSTFRPLSLDTQYIYELQ
ncbi:MAG: hypothetical protein ACYC4R_16085 [Anaerolineae bacterium]